MVDTVRSIAALLALLANNTTGNISPQDMRDVVVSLEPALGGMYVSSSAATTFSDSVTPVKALGTTLIAAGAHNFDMPASNRLRYTGAADVSVVCIAGLSITAGANNKDTEMSFAKNGTVITDSVASRKIGTGADVGRAVVIGIDVMSQNDYIEVFLLNTTDTTSITLPHMTMGIFGIVT